MKSVVIGFRLKESLYRVLKERAGEKSVGKYIKQELLRREFRMWYNRQKALQLPI